VHVTAPEWTEGRLDDLSDKVDRRFERVDQRLDRIDEKVERGFERVDERFDREFGRVNDRLDSIQRAMIYAMVSITCGILAGFSAILVLIATQL
jgi:tetrahydromethanopterin S-methyltransferase subunit G